MRSGGNWIGLGLDRRGGRWVRGLGMVGRVWRGGVGLRRSRGGCRGWGVGLRCYPFRERERSVGVVRDEWGSHTID